MSKLWTYIVKEPMRTQLLGDFGLSDSVISLGVDSNWPDEIFGFCCRKPTLSSDNQNETTLDSVVAVWETDLKESYSVRRVDGGLEYLFFNAKKPETLQVIGHSIQSLLGGLFEELVQSARFTRVELLAAAEIVGFNHVEKVIDFVLDEAKQNSQTYYERRYVFLKGLE
jgi:hypothetical protein